MTGHTITTKLPARDSYLAALAVYDIDPGLAAAAYDNLAAGTVVGLSFSGKIASGKDSAAVAAISRLGIGADHRYWAEPLKAEMTDIIETVRSHDQLGVAIDDITVSFDAPGFGAGAVAGLLWVPTRDADEGELTGWSRTPEIRTALQFWGSEVRRAQDPLHWVRLSLTTIVTAFADGRSVFLTDTRFPNEADAAGDAGLTRIRLNVTRDEQIRRVQSRDGLHADLSALDHLSELALDDYADFDVVVWNQDRPLDATVDEIVAQLS